MVVYLLVVYLFGCLLGCLVPLCVFFLFCLVVLSPFCRSVVYLIVCFAPLASCLLVYLFFAHLSCVSVFACFAPPPLLLFGCFLQVFLSIVCLFVLPRSQDLGLKAGLKSIIHVKKTTLLRQHDVHREARLARKTQGRRDICHTE